MRVKLSEHEGQVRRGNAALYDTNSKMAELFGLGYETSLLTRSTAPRLLLSVASPSLSATPEVS